MIRRTLIAIFAALALLLASAPAYAAHWHTVETLNGAKHQACKKHLKTGGWKIRNRVNARHAKTWTKAYMRVTHHGKATKRIWKSGRVRPGKISKGAVKVPGKGTGWKLEIGMGSKHSGGGGMLRVGDVKRC